MIYSCTFMYVERSTPEKFMTPMHPTPLSGSLFLAMTFVQKWAFHPLCSQQKSIRLWLPDTLTSTHPQVLGFYLLLPSKTQGACAYSVKEPLWDDCSHISMAHTSVVCAEVKRWKSPFLRTEFFLSNSPKQLFDPGFSILAGIVQGHQSQASDSTVAMELGYLTQEKRKAR